jgi:hypothetical protein
MPGARNVDFRQGDWKELLVESCLAAIAFTTRVPRQEDVGHDFFCTLCEPKDRMLWAGLSFTVQAKSDTKPLVFEKPYEVKWITELENPFLIAVANREDLRVDIYSTWFRLNGILRKKARRIELQPGAPTRDANPWTAEDRSKQVIALGKPIVSATIGEFLDKPADIGNVLKQWVTLDRQNIVRREIGLYYVTGPHPNEESYQTNEALTRNTPIMRWVYSHPENLEKCKLNFGLSATALRLAVGRKYETSMNNEAVAKKVQALDAILREYWDTLDPLCQHALQDCEGFNRE